MKVNTSSVIIGLAGKPFTDEANIPLTYRAVIHASLNQPKQGEVIGAEMSARRYGIIQKLYPDGSVDLTDPERGVIAEAMDNSNWVPEIRGLVKDFLDSDMRSRSAAIAKN